MSYDFRMLSTPESLPISYHPPFPQEPRAYRLTGSAMGAILEVMFRTGVFDELTPPPDLAAAPDEASVEALLALEPSGAGLVLPFKFTSNDGWLVTPAECRAIAVGIREAVETRFEEIFPFEEGKGPSVDDYRAFLLDWATFNEVAAGVGGYRVE